MAREDRPSRRGLRGGLSGRGEGARPQAQAEAEARNGDRRDDGSSKTAPLQSNSPDYAHIVADPRLKTRTGCIRLPSVTVIALRREHISRCGGPFIPVPVTVTARLGCRDHAGPGPMAVPR